MKEAAAARVAKVSEEWERLWEAFQAGVYCGISIGNLPWGVQGAEERDMAEEAFHEFLLRKGIAHSFDGVER